MRLFYEQHGMHRYSLTLDEVREHLRARGEIAYTEEQAEQDLRQLVQWGNLTAEQDRSPPAVPQATSTPAKIPSHRWALSQVFRDFPIGVNFF